MELGGWWSATGRQPPSSTTRNSSRTIPPPTRSTTRPTSAVATWACWRGWCTSGAQVSGRCRPSPRPSCQWSVASRVGGILSQFDYRLTGHGERGVGNHGSRPAAYSGRDRRWSGKCALGASHGCPMGVRYTRWAGTVVGSSSAHSAAGGSPRASPSAIAWRTRLIASRSRPASRRARATRSARS